MKNTTQFKVGDVLKIDTKYQDPVNLDFQLITTEHENVDKFDFQIDGSVVFQFLGRFQFLRKSDFIIVQILDAPTEKGFNGSVGFIRENEKIMFKILNDYELPILWYKEPSDSEFTTFKDFYTDKENAPYMIISRILHLLYEISIHNDSEYYDFTTGSAENENECSFQEAIKIIFGTPAEPELNSPKRLTFELNCEIQSPKGSGYVYLKIDRNVTHLAFNNSSFYCDSIYEPEFTWKETFDIINKGLSEIEEMIYGDDPDDWLERFSIQYFYSLVDINDKYISNDIQYLHPLFKSNLCIVS